jgi:AcrR family transcriptional regulator
MVVRTETRDAIVWTASLLFASRGYERTSLADVAAAASVRTGSIYHFFQTKASLLQAVLTMYLDGLEPIIMQPAFARTDDPVERVFEVLADYRERVIASGFTYRCPIGSLALEIANELPEARALVEQNFVAWRRAIARSLDAARDRYPGLTDTESTAAFVLTVMEGALMQSVTQQSIAPFDRSIQQLRHYIACLQTKGPS